MHASVYIYKIGLQITIHSTRHFGIRKHPHLARLRRKSIQRHAHCSRLYCECHAPVAACTDAETSLRVNITETDSLGEITPYRMAGKIDNNVEHSVSETRITDGCVGGPGAQGSRA